VTIQFNLDGILLPYQTVRMNTDAEQGVIGLPSAAWYGEPSTAGVRIEDPGGTLDIDGWHTFTVEESACTGAERIFTGWIFGKNIDRGQYRNGAGRVWDCDIIDQNAAFSFEVFRASSAKRPEETDLARVAFAQASAPMAGTPVYDNGRFNTTDNPVNFGPSDYITQYPAELFMSVVGTSGKNFYAYWDDSANQISLHYDLFADNPASTLSISNVLADYNGTTVFAPAIDASLSRSPEDQYTGILFGYLGGQYVYARDQDTIDALNPTNPEPLSVEFKRDLVYRTDRVGKVATANSLVQSMLAVHGAERDTITFMVQLPASVVNKLHAGMSFTGTFSHLPGYASPGATLQVIRRNVIPTAGTDDLYDVHIEARAAGLNRGPGGGGGGGPFQPTCDIDNVSLEQEVYAGPVESPPGTYTSTWGSTPTPGNLLIYSFISEGSPEHVPTPTVAGWTYQADVSVAGVGGQSQYVAVYTRIAASSEPLDVAIVFTGSGSTGRTYPYGQLQEWAGVDTVDVVAELSDSDGSEGLATITITPTAGTLGVLVATFGVDGPIHNLPNIGGFITDDEVNIGPQSTRTIGHLLVSDASGSYTIGTDRSTGTQSASVALSLICTNAGGIPPGALMHVKNEFVADGDGTTTSFTTRYPYASGSLEVFVDGVPIINGITEVDPDAGTFSLDFAPLGAQGDTRAERVTVNYQANVGGPGT